MHPKYLLFLALLPPVASVLVGDPGGRLQTQTAPAASITSPEQALQHAGHEPDATNLPVAIDGAKTPEKIPDRLAYYHFIMAVAEHAEPSPDELDRRAALFKHLHFSAETKGNSS